uniref:(northern house mosquito) hypothetical protein n=1 Tax=Culex pipiens TaxID=7175 RepID=A0A8D8D6P6_CULPI
MPYVTSLSDLLWEDVTAAESSSICSSSSMAEAFSGSAAGTSFGVLLIFLLLHSCTDRPPSLLRESRKLRRPCTPPKLALRRQLRFVGLRPVWNLQTFSGSAAGFSSEPVTVSGRCWSWSLLRLGLVRV